MKKIMFNDKYGLTQAVLDGRKTMTRRIVPKKVADMVKAYQQEYYDGSLEHISVQDAVFNMVTCEHMFNPHYKVGEIVAIAQRYKDAPNLIRKAVHYHGEESKAGWNNKMFVKAEYMPHHIKITGIKAEFLQDISDGDCLREGVLHSDKYAMPFGIPLNNGGVFFYYNTSRDAFAALIDKVSGKGTWDRNPMVLCYEFELVD